MKIEIYLWLYHLQICIKYVVKFSKLVNYETNWKEFCLYFKRSHIKLFKELCSINLHVFLDRIQSVPSQKLHMHTLICWWNKKAPEKQWSVCRHSVDRFQSGHSVSNFKSWASIFGLKLLRNFFGAIVELASHQVWSFSSGKPAKSKRRSQLLAGMSHSKFL